MIIKKATKNDALGIQQVLFETWLSTYPNKKIGITSEDIKEKFKHRFSREFIKRRNKKVFNMSDNKILLTAKDKNKIIGICMAEKRKKNNKLLAIYVLPDYQRKGIGMIFWKRVVKFFGNKKDIIVHVATYNKKAINFYKKLGFINTGKFFTKKIHRMPISGKFIPETELVIKRFN